VLGGASHFFTRLVGAGPDGLEPQCIAVGRSWQYIPGRPRRCAPWPANQRGSRNGSPCQHHITDTHDTPHATSSLETPSAGA
jgi:hypothetical protein